jgi:putative glycosyltransferase
MKLSIVSTLYQSGLYLEEFYARCVSAAEKITSEFEIILVNDGSPDNSLNLAIEIHEKDPRVVVVDLSRNFGHHKAMMTGLAHAKGRHIFLIDSDLEEDPEWLHSFSQQMLDEKCDVVYGVQGKRKGNLSERFTGNLFYWFFQKVTRVDIPKNVVTARLMTHRYVQSLLRFDERELFLAVLWHITGFEQHPQIVQKLSTSETTYTLRHKITILVNSITAFSNRPLVGIFHFGVMILAMSLVYISYLIFNWIFLSTPLSGWTSIMASIWLLGGFIISFIGVIGIYLSKVFSETKRRPYTIIKHTYDQRK